MQAVNQLCSHFEAYSGIPKITELREKFKGIKEMLKSHVFSDFARLLFNLNIGISVYWEANLQTMDLHAEQFMAVNEHFYLLRHVLYLLLC
jgi:hypothetical protein